MSETLIVLPVIIEINGVKKYFCPQCGDETDSVGCENCDNIYKK